MYVIERKERATTVPVCSYNFQNSPENSYITLLLEIILFIVVFHLNADALRIVLESRLGTFNQDRIES